MTRTETLLFALLLSAAGSASAQCLDLYQCNHVDAGEPSSRNTGPAYVEGFPDPVTISGEMVHRDDLGSTEYFAQASPGHVAAMVRGDFSSPGATYGYRPSANAVANSLYFVEGPVGSRGDISFNFDFSGSQSLTGFDAFYVAELRTKASVDISTKGTHHCSVLRTSGRTETTCGSFVNTIGEERVGDVSYFEPREGHLTTTTYSFEPGQYSFQFRLQIEAELLALGLPDEAVFHNSFEHTFSFAKEGPVANLPDGWNFHGPDVVNNRFVGSIAAPVPEPSTALLALSGLLLVAGRIRRSQRKAV